MPPPAVIADARARLAHPNVGECSTAGSSRSTELRALCSIDAAIYIGGDSGPLHVAATSHVPIVGLYGPTLPARSAPWRADEYGRPKPSRSHDLACRPVRPAAMRAWRFPLPDAHHAESRSSRPPERVTEPVKCLECPSAAATVDVARSSAPPHASSRPGCWRVFGVGAALQFSIADRAVAARRGPSSAGSR